MEGGAEEERTEVEPTGTDGGLRAGGPRTATQREETTEETVGGELSHDRGSSEAKATKARAAETETVNQAAWGLQRTWRWTAAEANPRGLDRGQRSEKEGGEEARSTVIQEQCRGEKEGSGRGTKTRGH